jgi:NTE family protein
VVCGTSIGALVGGAYVAGELDRLEEWVRALTMKDVIAFMDFTLSGGLVRGGRLMDYFRQHFTDRRIEELATPFAAVATALETGRGDLLRRARCLRP